MEGKLKEARGEETGNLLHLAAVADLGKLLAAVEKIMEDMAKEDLTGLHKLWYPGIRDMSTWSKFGAHGEHGDVFLFSNLGAL